MRASSSSVLLATLALAACAGSVTEARLQIHHPRSPASANDGNGKASDDGATAHAHKSKSAGAAADASTASATTAADAVAASAVPSGAFTNFKTLPKTWQPGQTGTNDCSQWGESSPDSMCQNVYLNSVDDFCLWAPPTPGTVGATEEHEVAWCLKSGYGTRLIPEGTITSAHFLKTKQYVQITGTGDLTKLNIADKDGGGELDPHGATGNGNPIGSLVFTNAFSSAGTYQQVHEWMNFMAYNEFCFRACKGADSHAANMCQHIYDTMGCDWVMPGNYDAGFESCEGASGAPPGIYGSSTWYQGEKSTPAAHPAPSSSKCKTHASVTNGPTTNKPTGKIMQPALPVSSSASSSTRTLLASTQNNLLATAVASSGSGSGSSSSNGSSTSSTSSAGGVAFPLAVSTLLLGAVVAVAHVAFF